MILSSASPLLVMSALAILALKYNPPASLDPFLLSINGFFFLDLLFSFLYPRYPENLPMVDACFSYLSLSASSAEGSPLRQPTPDPSRWALSFLLHYFMLFSLPMIVLFLTQHILSYWHHSVNSLWTEDPGRLVCTFSSGRECISHAAATELLICSMHEWGYRGVSGGDGKAGSKDHSARVEDIFKRKEMEKKCKGGRQMRGKDEDGKGGGRPRKERTEKSKAQKGKRRWGCCPNKGTVTTCDWPKWLCPSRLLPEPLS